MTSKPILIVGLPWYREADYDRLKAIFTDGHVLPPTFKQWEKVAEKIRQTRMAKGEIVVQAHIDPSTFGEWCRTHGKGVDASGRLHFANTIAAEYGRKLQNSGH